MPIAEVIELPRGSKEKYDQVIQETGLSGSQLALGQLVHFVGPLAGGGWQIVNVWESQAPEQAVPFHVFSDRRNLEHFVTRFFQVGADRFSAEEIKMFAHTPVSQPITSQKMCQKG